MKKLLFLAIIAAFILAMTSVAFAGWGVHQGGSPGFGTTTDACAGCHRAHTAVSPITVAGPNWTGESALLYTGTTTLGFCYSCHGSTATGANTDVQDGEYVSGRGGPGDDSASGAALNAGGFDKVDNVVATSQHSLEGGGTIWGEGGAGGGTAGPPRTMTLKCTNCHDPHGVLNYRILILDPDTDSESAETLSVVSDDTLTPTFTSVDYDSGFTAWCVDCHERYSTKADASYDVGDGGGARSQFRHQMDVDINAGTPSYTTTLDCEDASSKGGSGTNDSVTCVTCHYAHGTDKTMTATAKVGPTAESALLKMNNRGVCEDCHSK